ncbi:unnamed protein product [Spirodela intermedia]|uniref:Uncharacterized protein n=1 Tax=Spirodela intermedia TaxID=51605 RepID=A0A7I8L6B1_SPIIN|nr:unnamed protein product [Spirodela intermedia]
MFQKKKKKTSCVLNDLFDFVRAARTQAPAGTNYDVHSPTWGDGSRALPLSAMEAARLGHGPC